MEIFEPFPLLKIDVCQLAAPITAGKRASFLRFLHSLVNAKVIKPETLRPAVNRMFLRDFVSGGQPLAVAGCRATIELPDQGTRPKRRLRPGSCYTHSIGAGVAIVTLYIVPGRRVFKPRQRKTHLRRRRCLFLN